MLFELKGVEHLQARWSEALSGAGVSSVGVMLVADPLANLSWDLVSLEVVRRARPPEVHICGWCDYHEVGKLATCLIGSSSSSSVMRYKSSSKRNERSSSF